MGNYFNVVQKSFFFGAETEPKKICALKKKVKPEKNILRRKKIYAPQKKRCHDYGIDLIHSIYHIDLIHSIYHIDIIMVY